jgi:hypothetical protein
VLAGGHRFGQATRKAKEGKFFDPTRTHTEFPESWSDDKILESILKVIDNPDSVKYIQPDGKIRFIGSVDGLNIRTVIYPDTGKVVTAFPN